MSKVTNSYCFTIGDVKITCINKCVKWCSIFLVIMEMQRNTWMTYHSPICQMARKKTESKEMEQSELSCSTGGNDINQTPLENYLVGSPVIQQFHSKYILTLIYPSRNGFICSPNGMYKNNSAIHNLWNLKPSVYLQTAKGRNKILHNYTAITIQQWKILGSSKTAKLISEDGNQDSS